MGDVTKILLRLEAGDDRAIDELLPIVEEELRKLASAKLNRERGPVSLQVTELVNEAYIRLADGIWKNRGHFFTAAAEAMRRILVDKARSRLSQKRGGERRRVEFNDAFIAIEERADEVISLHEALDDLEGHNMQAAQLVKLRYFAGMRHEEAAVVMGTTKNVADRLWRIARVWLFKRLGEPGTRETQERT